MDNTIIRDLFAKDINRSINGVVKVQDSKDGSIRQELDEYVVTRELQRHFATFFKAYGDAIDARTDKIGVWISGFFGSGKSHFLKMLSYLLENRQIGGKSAIRYFDGKIVDPMVAAAMERACSVPTQAILFNIDSKAGQWKQGDTAPTALLRGFERMFYEARGFYGVQYHPEVNHTENGSLMLKNFLYEICHAKGDWTMGDYKETAIRQIREKVGDGKVLLALSGGVDSSVAAALVAEAVGSQLTCVFVDHGLMRLNEGDEVEEAFKKWDINFVRANAEELFLSKLSGVSEPEHKRKIIGEEFIRVFEAEAKKIGQVDYLVQGTIYPDVIESGTGDAAVIKSHHNVGGLPDYVDFKEIIEPLRMLFKDEVRQLGRELGLPEYLVMRQPFPGPGLAIRVIGEVTKDKLDTLRLADFIFRDEIAKAHLEGTMNQYFAVLTNMRSVGVQGDGRTYDYTLALRSVTTTDFMTADWARLPADLIARMSGRIINEVKGVNRVVYDVSSKPPSTIEWE